MNWLFRRHFWVLHLVFLSICAVIAAKTFTTLAGYWLSKSIPEKPSASSFAEPEKIEQPKNFSQVNERNLFAARREQISFTDLEEETEADPGRWQDAQLSSLPLKLISTMVFLDPFDSRTVITSSSGVATVHSIGECEQYQKKYDPMQIETVLTEKKWEPERACNDIAGMAVVKRIEEFRVYIFNLRDKKYEYLSLLPDDKRPIHRNVEAKFETIEGEGVRKIGATSYEIDQGEFDKALGNVARLMTEARAIPEKDGNGNFMGFRLVYLKEGSLFEKIGIEKNDILTRINGYELNSPEKALQLFGKLKTAPQFTIDLKREEKSVTLDYSVVP